LSSPRALEACKMAGFEPQDLIHKSKEEMEYEWGSIPDEVFEMRYNAYEKRR